MDIAGWVAALEASPLGEWMRGDPLAYPIVNVVHLFGLVLLVGPILLLDLRLLGYARQFSVVAVATLLTNWAAIGLVVLIASGFLMFTADATPLLANPVLQAKLCGVALGIANAIVFRLLWNEDLNAWDYAAPLLGRMQAGLSIALWLSVATLGRWIAYS